MNSTLTAPASAATAHTITEADVIAFFAAKKAAHPDLPSLSVGFGSDYHKKFVATYDFGGSRDSIFGDTMDEAIALVRAKVPTPAQLAAEKRAKAEKLISEAEQLEESAEELEDISRERDEPDYDAPRPLTAMENMQQNDEHHVR